MMEDKKLKIKVYSEGNTFIGVLPSSQRRVYRRDRSRDGEYLAFRKYYAEAKNLKLKGNELYEYLSEKMLNDPGESYLCDKERINELIKKDALRVHNKKKRYRRKLGWFHPNWFITFTYDDELTDAESFEIKLRRCLANLAFRNGWKYIGAREFGSKGGRLHFHFIAYIPEGNMVGQLFKDYHWDGFKREYFTNNTFFHERFGDAEFKRVEGSDILSGRLSNYLIKYLEKQDQKLIYSRGLATEVEMEASAEDVFYTFIDYHTEKLYLSMDLFYSEEEIKRFSPETFFKIDSEGMGYDPSAAEERLAIYLKEKQEKKRRRSA